MLFLSLYTFLHLNFCSLSWILVCQLNEINCCQCCLLQEETKVTNRQRQAAANLNFPGQPEWITSRHLNTSTRQRCNLEFQAMYTTGICGAFKSMLNLKKIKMQGYGLLSQSLVTGLSVVPVFVRVSIILGALGGSVPALTVSPLREPSVGACLCIFLYVRLMTDSGTDRKGRRWGNGAQEKLKDSHENEYTIIRDKTLKNTEPHGCANNTQWGNGHMTDKKKVELSGKRRESVCDWWQQQKVRSWLRWLCI